MPGLVFGEFHHAVVTLGYEPELMVPADRESPPAGQECEAPATRLDSATGEGITLEARKTPRGWTVE